MNPLIAPLGTLDCSPPHEGRANPKPWERRVWVTLAHLGTPELLPPVLALWRCQTIRPYIVLFDMGSTDADLLRVLAHRAPDCEVHALAPQGFRHSSGPIAWACDAALARCEDDYMLFTHTDVFPKRPDLLEYLIGLCSEQAPAVGWQMSPRDGSDGKMPFVSNSWRGVAGHACLMVHRPTVQALGATWGYLRGREQFGLEAPGDWDTEVTFSHCLRAAGKPPRLLGDETNFETQETPWWTHCRSYTGALLHRHRGLDRIGPEMAEAIRQAWEQVEAWGGQRQPVEAPRLSLGLPVVSPERPTATLSIGGAQVARFGVPEGGARLEVSIEHPGGRRQGTALEVRG